MDEKQRLDTFLAESGRVETRSRAANLISMGKVKVNGTLAKKPGQMVSEADAIDIKLEAEYVSRAGYKLASIAETFHLQFEGKTMLDVGSSTGGFTDFALQNGAKKVYAVDVGTKQLHPSLLGNPKIELHEQTDIRDFVRSSIDSIDIIVVDVSFVSLRDILPYLAKVMHDKTQLVAMVKPQFEARNSGLKHKGVIKNAAMRRNILKDFESWVKNEFITLNKADSDVSGSKGNVERFYLLRLAK